MAAFYPRARGKTITKRGIFNLTDRRNRSTIITGSRKYHLKQ
jgi:hypothetical protein